MAEVLAYKCPSCGGGIEFDSASQKLKCPYCDAEYELDALKDYDESLNNKKEEYSWESTPGADWQEGEQEGLGVYVCNSCGGEIVCDGNTSATSCPYCDNPVVLTGNLSGSLKPNYIIPFKLDKKAAIEGLKKHLTGKKLLPKVFKDENHLEEIKGVYVPFWLFNANAQGSVSYKATKVRMWSDSNYNYTETSYYAVHRGGSLGFDNVPVDGSSKIDDTLMESIEPFDITQAVDFQTAYLSGYLADKYDVDAESSIARANERIKNSMVDTFRSTVRGYDSVTVEGVTINLSDSTSTYALYPVWLLNTSWNGQKYTFAMNGQTGKFVGDLPVDKKALRRHFLLSGGLVAAITLGLLCLINLL